MNLISWHYRMVTGEFKNPATKGIIEQIQIQIQILSEPNIEPNMTAIKAITEHKSILCNLHVRYCQWVFRYQAFQHGTIPTCLVFSQIVKLFQIFTTAAAILQCSSIFYLRFLFQVQLEFSFSFSFNFNLMFCFYLGDKEVFLQQDCMKNDSCQVNNA